MGFDAPGTATVGVTVIAHRPSSRRGGPYRVIVQDAQCEFALVFFRSNGEYLRKSLPEGAQRLVSGKVEMFDGIYQMVHPDHILADDAQAEIPDFEPVYPLTQGVTQKVMAKAARSAVQRAPNLDEWADPALVSREAWPPWLEAVKFSHAPQDLTDVAVDAPARSRLAYDELFAHQLTLALARRRERETSGRITDGDGALRRKVLNFLPYTPTNAQSRAAEEIAADMKLPQRMNRLLQGDVGAGKTLVAFLALLIAVEAGGQGVMMAPTEILARQHLDGLQALADNAGINLAILTGRDKSAIRREKLAKLASGDIDILVGTHAVFQADVVFNDLRLAVVDEQHRFGVRQRLDLAEKGAGADVLVMTATPIPRSLALAHYGDMDVSILDEKPPGRQPITTAVVSLDRLDQVVEKLRKAVADGRQCYWVCPLVEDSEVSDLTSADQRFKHLRAALGAGASDAESLVGIVHGQMPADEKDAAMSAFQAGKTRVLVATTVIEVGVNVPNATIMVIERAETFGLAQLHQLRGRVGRGSQQSTCLLVYQSPLSESGRRRLEVLRETEDGFEISETDLKMRGAGDLIGTAQSGLPQFQVADLERQSHLMAMAQKDARLLLEMDPNLTSERGKAARILLWLMRRDETINLITVG
jgi:ATP-dependent DNA helicase RecG